MLVTCYECGGKVSEEAKVCPHCGYPEAGYYSVEKIAERRIQKAIRQAEARREEEKKEQLRLQREREETYRRKKRMGRGRFQDIDDY